MSGRIVKAQRQVVRGSDDTIFDHHDRADRNLTLVSTRGAPRRARSASRPRQRCSVATGAPDVPRIPPFFRRDSRPSLRSFDTLANESAASRRAAALTPTECATKMNYRLNRARTQLSNGGNRRNRTNGIERTSRTRRATHRTRCARTRRDRHRRVSRVRFICRWATCLRA